MWPRYGTSNGYEQPGIGSNGFQVRSPHISPLPSPSPHHRKYIQLGSHLSQDVMSATMMAALEWGLFEYAKAVLTNWLTYYQREAGAVMYRGLEMPMQGRLLTICAMYFRYTRDAAVLVDHLDKVSPHTSLLPTFHGLLTPSVPRSLTSIRSAACHACSLTGGPPPSPPTPTPPTRAMACLQVTTRCATVKAQTPEAHEGPWAVWRQSARVEAPPRV